jgi:hypothetical protein
VPIQRVEIAGLFFHRAPSWFDQFVDDIAAIEDDALTLDMLTGSSLGALVAPIRTLG